MALIPAGSFEIRDHFDGEKAWERPVHAVELNTFHMDKNEVTVGWFRRFVEESGYAYNLWDDVAVFSPKDKRSMGYIVYHSFPDTQQ